MMTLLPLFYFPLCFVAGLMTWRRHTRFFRFLFFQLTLAAMVEIGRICLLYGKPNAWLYNIEILCEVLLVCIAIHQVLLGRRARISLMGLMVFASLWWIGSILHYTVFHFANWYYFLGGIMITAFVLVVIAQQIEYNHLSVNQTAYMVCFWGLLFFFAISAEIIALIGYVVGESPAFGKRIYLVVVVGAALRYMLLGISFAMLKPKPKPKLAVHPSDTSLL